VPAGLPPGTVDIGSEEQPSSTQRNDWRAIKRRHCCCGSQSVSYENIYKCSNGPKELGLFSCIQLLC